MTSDGNGVAATTACTGTLTRGAMMQNRWRILTRSTSMYHNTTITSAVIATTIAARNVEDEDFFESADFVDGTDGSGTDGSAAGCSAAGCSMAGCSMAGFYGD